MGKRGGQEVWFNGVDGATGRYRRPPASHRDLAALASGRRLEPPTLEAPRRSAPPAGGRRLGVAPRRRGNRRVYGVLYGVDATDLSQCGWGVVFSQGCDPAIRRALEPLLEHRRQQAAAERSGRYRELVGLAAADLGGETAVEFLERHGSGPGVVDPDRMPYYLLLVGGPREIPFSFQYQLDIQHAVGRLHFDTPEEYRRYAEAVVAAETRPRSRERRVSLFAPENPGDPATELTARQLVEPLARRLAVHRRDWRVETVRGDEATRGRLARLFAGGEPAVLVAACHGVAFPAGDPRQAAQQGALVCQEWPGPEAAEPGDCREHYLAAEDLPEDADLAGLVVFLVGCFTAGTPRRDGFSPLRRGRRRDLAPAPFLARLPRHLLAHPAGGALAVVGHVDQAGSCSFSWGFAGEQCQTFDSACRELLAGRPVGLALESFGQRYGELTSALTAARENGAGDLTLANLWTAAHDARGYVVLGDPAVRLAGVPPAPGASSATIYGTELPPTRHPTSTRQGEP